MAKLKTEPPSPGASTPRLQKLLAQVATYYRRRFDAEPRARKYLAERGIQDSLALDRFGAGYCDGTLKDMLPFDDQVIADLKTLGILKDNGKELFAECVTFALWSTAGACVGMYGRRLFNSDVKHLYLPGPRHGLINWQAARRCAESSVTPTGGTQRGTELVIAESIIDALSLYVAGVVDVIPCYGTSLTSDHIELLTRFKPKRIALCFDGDDAGRMIAPKIAAELHEASKGGAVRIVDLPGITDANELLVDRGAAALAALVTEPREKPAAPPARATPTETPTSPPPATTPIVEPTPTGFALHITGRVYEVKASARQGTQLRVTLKAYTAKDPERFELSTIDVYSQRSRQWFASQCSGLFGIDAKQAEADLRAVMLELEHNNAKNSGVEERTEIELTDTERTEALALLNAPNLIEHVTDALSLVGYVGESINKELAYLVATSRKLERPLSLLVESRSGAGKSALQDAVLRLMPEEECLKYSRITDQALFYTAKDGLEGKLLAIEEAAGMGGAVYSIRALQSSEALRVAATGKDPTTGKMKTEEYEVKARTAVMMTTTRPDFDEETKSRFLCATIDETAEMTRQILEAQRHDDTLDGIVRRKKAQRLMKLHQNAQRLLRSVTVANPFAPQLTFPTHSLSARRDNRKYLGLIKAIALLYQCQREVKRKRIDGEDVEYIEVTLGDIAIANRIAQKVLVKHHDITPQARQLFGLIRKMLVNGGGHGEHETLGFNRRRLREHTGWSDWQVRTHLGELVELEYLRIAQGRFGKEYLYELSDMHLLEALPGFAVTDAKALKKVLVEPGAGADLAVVRSNLEAKRPNLAVKNRHLEAP